MSKKLFSDSEVKLLSKNKYVTKVSNKAITYSFEFKKRFVEEYNNGKLPRVIFEEAGFNIEMVGMKRIETARKRWRKAFKVNGELGLKDSRKGKSGRPLERKLSDPEKIKRLEAQIKYLEIENEFLKKLDEIERGDV
jgi:transposase-like protein